MILKVYEWRSKVKIPFQLRNADYRFYLVRKETKLPLEKAWNTVNNYPYFHTKIQNHLKKGGNYGVVCGIGGLLVIDFDDRSYYNKMIESGMLPPTFTVLSAGKRLPHLYYHYKGSEFQKIGVDECGVRVCDIQSFKCGVVAPNSSAGGRYYDIDNYHPISEITLLQLKKAFNITSLKSVRHFSGSIKEQEGEIKETINHLISLGLERKKNTHFKCFKHPMSGGGNLHVMPDGRIHCFHCQHTWHTREDFEKDYYKNTNYLRVRLL